MAKDYFELNVRIDTKKLAEILPDRLEKVISEALVECYVVEQVA